MQRRRHPAGVDLQAGDQVDGRATRRPACGAPGRAASPTRRARRRRPARRPAGPRRGAASRRAAGWSGRPGGSAPTGPGCAFWGIVDEPPPVALARARRSRAGDRVSTSLAIRPQASVQPDQRVAEPGDGGRAVVCHGAAGARPRRWATCGDQRPGGCRRARPTAARVPAAPPICTGKVERRRGRRTRRARRSATGAALSPNVVGTACWVSVRATIGVPRWVVGERRRARSTWPRISACSGATASCATASGRCRGRPGWSGRGAASAARRVASSSVLRSRPTSGDHRVAAGLGLAREPLVVVVRRPGRRGRRARPAARSRRRRGRRARPPRRRPSPRGRSRRVKWSPARSSPGQKQVTAITRSVSRIGEEDGLALALEPDVEDEAVRRRARDQGAPALGVDGREERVVATCSGR